MTLQPLLKYRRSGLFLSLLLLNAFVALHVLQAQDFRLITVNDARYQQIQRLQHRGYLLELHPTSLPYTYQEVSEAVASADVASMSRLERRWLEGILDRRIENPDPEDIVIRAEGGGSLTVADSDRLDVLRPLDDAVKPYQMLYIKGAATRGNWAGQFGLIHSRYYDEDPDGLDTALRLQVRAENGYVGYGNKSVALYLGRFSNQWAPYGDTATLVSDNPRAYDQINFRFGSQKYSLRSFFAELDAITGDGRFTGTAGADSVQSGLERRFLFGHRVDWRPTKSLSLTLMESVLISGPGTGLSLRFLNPLTAVGFENDNIPKNDENNAFLGLIVWWQVNSTTLHTQVMMDDLDIMNFGNERTSIAGAVSVVHAFPDKPFDLRVAGDAVASRTYNTDQAEGKYLYLLRGIATQFSDYAHVSAGLNWYADDVAEGLVVGPRLHYLAQGESTIAGPFAGLDTSVATILSGTVEKTVRAALYVEYQPVGHVRFKIDAGYNSVTNVGHVMGNDAGRFSGQASFSFRLPLTIRDKADF